MLSFSNVFEFKAKFLKAFHLFFPFPFPAFPDFLLCRLTTSRDQFLSSRLSLPHRSLCRFIPKYTTITANISLSYFSKNKPVSNFIVTYFYPSLPCCYLVEFDYNTFFNTFLPSILSESEVTSVQCQTPEREKSNTWLH